jgi:hypothetical protein
MDRKIKSSFTLLQNKLSNDKYIIITSKFVLYENIIYVKDNNSWKETNENAESLINSLGFFSKDCLLVEVFFCLFILISFS